MTDLRPVRVAVVGYGYWGPNIVRTLRAMADADVAVCCDASPERRREARERFRIPVTDRLEDILADASIEAVILATPADTHRELTLACLAHDKHVLVEKPFATCTADAETMYGAAERRGLALEAGHIFLYNPSVKALRREMAEGTLGELRAAFAIRASHGPRVRNDVDITFDCMVHDIYILRELLGRATEVSANSAAFLSTGIADSASASISFANGARAFCYASWYEPIKTRRMTLVGSRAMADYDDLREGAPVRILARGYEPIEGADALGNQGVQRFDRGEEVPQVPWEEPLRKELEAFVARVRGQTRESCVSPASVLAVTRTLEAIGRSVRRGGAPEQVEGGEA